MKLKIVIAPVVKKTFEGHVGIIGHRGGSAPKGTPQNADKYGLKGTVFKDPERLEEFKRLLGGDKDYNIPINVEEALNSMDWGDTKLTTLDIRDAYEISTDFEPEEDDDNDNRPGLYLNGTNLSNKDDGYALVYQELDAYVAENAMDGGSVNEESAQEALWNLAGKCDVMGNNGEFPEWWSDTLGDVIDDINNGTGDERFSPDNPQTQEGSDFGPKFPQITVKLTGTDGNAFAVLGAVKNAMKKGGRPPQDIADFMEEAMGGDYDHLLQTAMKYVNVR